MKKILSFVVAFFMFGIASSYAQSVEYQGEVDLGYSFGIGDFGIDRINLHTVQGAKIGDHFSLGAGLGVDWYYNEYGSDIMLPIYLNAKGYLPVSDKFSPFASLDLGYGVGVTTNASGFYWSPSIGIKYSKLKVQIGYVSQSLSDSGVSVSMSAFQFKVGLVF